MLFIALFLLLLNAVCHIIMFYLPYCLRMPCTYILKCRILPIFRDVVSCRSLEAPDWRRRSWPWTLDWSSRPHSAFCIITVQNEVITVASMMTTVRIISCNDRCWWCHCLPTFTRLLDFLSDLVWGGTPVASADLPSRIKQQAFSASFSFLLSRHVLTLHVGIYHTTDYHPCLTRNFAEFGCMKSCNQEVRVAIIVPVAWWFDQVYSTWP